MKRLHLGLGALLLASCNLLCAGEFWNPMSWFRTDGADVLVVTGNYGRPRLLAELIQRKTGHSILLVSPIVGGEELFLLPASGEALVEQQAKYNDLLTFLKPKKIVFLGDSDYLPADYVEKARNLYPVVVISGDDWQKNAEAAGTLFHLRSLPGRYQELTTAMDAALNSRPGLTPVAPAVDAAAASAAAATAAAAEPPVVEPPVAEHLAEPEMAPDGTPAVKTVTVQGAKPAVPAAAGEAEIVPAEPVAPPRLAPPAKK
ncbi:MAG: hypothetical protein WC708_17935 [Lentisphaeria bacterium]